MSSSKPKAKTTPKAVAKKTPPMRVRLGRLLHDERELLGVKITRAAKDLRVHRGTITNIEAGNFEPKFTVIAEYASYLGPTARRAVAGLLLGPTAGL